MGGASFVHYFLFLHSSGVDKLSTEGGDVLMFLHFLTKSLTTLMNKVGLISEVVLVKTLSDLYLLGSFQLVTIAVHMP